MPQLLHPSWTGGLNLQVRSAKLPVGAGLGSSAAFSVSLSAALLRLQLLCVSMAAEAPESLLAQARDAMSPAGQRLASLLQTHDIDGRSARPSPTAKQLINAWAYSSECILHGTPSGLDNSVSCYGEAVKLMRAAPAEALLFEPVKRFPKLQVLLTNTKVPRKTREQVSGVRRLHESLPSVTIPVFEAISSVADAFLDLISGGSVEGAALAQIGRLVSMNHALLTVLGVSAPALQLVCDVAGKHGLPTKLTGAGGGGCAFSILGGEEELDSSMETRVQRCSRTLRSHRFDCYRTTVGGEGVLWHEPEQEAARARPPSSPRLLVASLIAVGVVAAALVSRRR